MQGVCRCGAKTEGAPVRFEGEVALTLYVCQECRQDGNELIQRMKPVKAAMDAARVPQELSTAAIRSILFAMMKL